ncbi:MAG: TRAP transporter substrate-binding protein [Pseudomonadota bacterium]
MKPTSAVLTRRATLLGAAAGASLAAPAVAQSGPRVLTMVTTWPRGLSGLWTGVERFTARVNAMSGGALQIEAFAAGEKMGAFDSFPAVQSGEADMYHAAEYYWQGRDKAYNFFTTVPFGFTAEEHTAWIRTGGGQALWDELSASYGLKGLMCGNTGVQMGGWYERPIETLDDMKGLKIRIPGIAADIFRALGSEPVSLPGGAIPQALFNGEINAVEWVGPYNDLDFGVQKVLQNYMFPGFHEPGTCASLGVNLALWNSLSETERTIIETAAATENRTMLAEYSANSGRALKQMVREYGTNVARFPDDIYAEVAALAAETITGIGQGSDFARRVVGSFQAFREQVMPYSNALTAKYGALRATQLGS